MGVRWRVDCGEGREWCLGARVCKGHGEYACGEIFWNARADRRGSNYLQFDERQRNLFWVTQSEEGEDGKKRNKTSKRRERQRYTE